MPLAGLVKAFKSEAGAKRAGLAASMPKYAFIVRERNSDWIWKFESPLSISEGIDSEENPGRSCLEKRIFYMKPLDSFTEDRARLFVGRTVVDVSGERIGSLQRTWLDPSTYQVEFAGIRIGWLFPSTRVVPARDMKFDEENGLLRVEHPRAFISKAPRVNPKAELAEVEKEEIDAYYGYFVPLRRSSDIKEMRPEDALDGPGVPAATASTDELLLHGEADQKRESILNAS
jgi:hypothetical protein